MANAEYAFATFDDIPTFQALHEEITGGGATIPEFTGLQSRSFYTRQELVKIVEDDEIVGICRIHRSIEEKPVIQVVAIWLRAERGKGAARRPLIDWLRSPGTIIRACAFEDEPRAVAVCLEQPGAKEVRREQMGDRTLIWFETED